MDIHERIRELCKRNQWSLSKLAKKAGLSETTVYDWYNENHYTPSRRAIEDICAVFGISLAEFYSDVEVDKLTDKEMKLLETFRKIPDKKKDAVLAMVEAFTE